MEGGVIPSHHITQYTCCTLWHSHLSALGRSLVRDDVCAQLRLYHRPLMFLLDVRWQCSIRIPRGTWREPLIYFPAMERVRQARRREKLSPVAGQSGLCITCTNVECLLSLGFPACFFATSFGCFVIGWLTGNFPHKTGHQDRRVCTFSCQGIEAFTERR